MKITDEAHEKAIKVLEHCAKRAGFYASGLPGGYEATWSRDSMITSFGASLIGAKFKTPFKKSIDLLGKNQSKHGQIPNAVGTYNTERRSDVTFNSIDSTLWWIIGNYVFAEAYKEKSILARNKKKIKAALTWLEYQDPNEDTLLVQQPTMDWQDAFPHKYGRAINTEALYYGVLRLLGRRKEASHLRRVVNGETEKYLSLFNKKLGYYHPWAWKTHGPNFREEENWFDTLGNLLAIVTGLANSKITESILRYIEKNRVNRPFPVKAIYPPIKKGSKEWHNYFEHAEAREPYQYLNGGIWPFIGGFYVAALIKAKKFAKAKKELELLAKVNRKGRPLEEYEKSKTYKKLGVTKDWQFLEWVEGKKGSIAGSSSPYQAWSAGMYIFAYECVKNKKVPYFI